MAVFGLTVLISATLIVQASRMWLSWYWGRSPQYEVRLRGAELEPLDAESWGRLGEFVWHEQGGNKARTAIPFLLRAEKADPDSVETLLVLAEVYEAAENIHDADAAFQRAQQIDPVSARVAWDYGNFLLRQRRSADGIREIRRAVATDPSLTATAISAMWNSGADVALILDSITSKNREASWDALDYFAARQETDAALKTWARILDSSGGEPFKLTRVFPLFDELISEGRTIDVEKTWSQALRASKSDVAPPFGNSLIWNGGFETKIVGGGLDWRIEKVPGAIISQDAGTHHSGVRSLRVDFTGGMNLDFANVFQVVPVEARTKYDFRAFLKTQDLSTDSGIRFEIVDAQHPKELDILTESLTGTNDWTILKANVRTGADTRFLEIRLRRFPSNAFDNKLSGTVWVDDVSLVPAAAAGKFKP